MISRNITDLSIYLWLELFRKVHEIYIMFLEYKFLQCISNSCNCSLFCT